MIRKNDVLGIAASFFFLINCSGLYCPPSVHIPAPASRTNACTTLGLVSVAAAAIISPKKNRSLKRVKESLAKLAAIFFTLSFLGKIYNQFSPMVTSAHPETTPAEEAPLSPPVNVTQIMQTAPMTEEIEPEEEIIPAPNTPATRWGRINPAKLMATPFRWIGAQLCKGAVSHAKENPEILNVITQRALQEAIKQNQPTINQAAAEASQECLNSTIKKNPLLGIFFNN